MTSKTAELSAEAEQARSLLSAVAVRERAQQMLQHGLDGRLDHFTVDLDRLGLRRTRS